MAIERARVTSEGAVYRKLTNGFAALVLTTYDYFPNRERLQIEYGRDRVALIRFFFSDVSADSISKWDKAIIHARGIIDTEGRTTTAGKSFYARYQEKLSEVNTGIERARVTSAPVRREPGMRRV